MTKTLYYNCDLCGKKTTSAQDPTWSMNASHVCRIHNASKKHKDGDHLEHVCKGCEDLAVDLTRRLWAEMRRQGRRVDLVALALGVELPRRSIEDEFYRGRQWPDAMMGTAPATVAKDTK